MKTTSQLSGDLQSAFEHPTGGVVGFVDDLLRLCPKQGLQLDWHADHCRVRSLTSGSEEVLARPLRKSVFRAMLARVAALCNERSPNSVSPYGGEACLVIGGNTVVQVSFVNTSAEQRMELRPAQPHSAEPTERPTNDVQVVDRMRVAVAELAARYGMPDPDLDCRVMDQWRTWLGHDLPWAGTGITDDEFFFLATLCGTMTLQGQRTHMREFFPRFVTEVGRDIRRFTRAIVNAWRLRSPWMKTRLVRMADVLSQRGQDMTTYTNNLRQLEESATAANPMPAFDAIVCDHCAGGQKTLSIFIRDCVLGNSFPIDSRVQNVLNRYGLPANERCLVSASLALSLNPRNVARLFYDAGGDGTFFTHG